MPSSRWQNVQDTLWAALEREPAAREAFLTGHCAGDPELLAEVHSLLEAHEGAGHFLGGPVPSAPGSPPGGVARFRGHFEEVADLTAEELTSWIEELVQAALDRPVAPLAALLLKERVAEANDRRGNVQRIRCTFVRNIPMKRPPVRFPDSWTTATLLEKF